jgi:hypothetical protein
MSNLVKHADHELRRAGLFDEDSDYKGMLGHAVMKMVRVFASEGHSGMSASLALQIFDRVARFKTLSPITNDPEEWMNVSDLGGDALGTVWQNKRDFSMFSTDGGKTYYSVDDKEREIHTSADPIKSSEEK